MCLRLGGYGRPADAAEEMDVVPESSSGLFPPRTQPAPHCPGCLPAEARGLEEERLLRCLHSPVVSTYSQILWFYGLGWALTCGKVGSKLSSQCGNVKKVSILTQNY